ncbi:MAG TPA: energy-coupling factor transporter transmembrane component T [Clostridia bacterium]|nr:energy-coupling factor transporter transmembrane component T [Clostridia bacterium]
MTLKRRHPTVILVFYMTVLVVTMSTHHPVAAALSFAFALILRFRVVGFRKAVRSLVYLLPMVVLIALFNSLFNNRGITVIATIGSMTFSLESALYGLVSGVMLSAVMLWFQSYNDMMESGRFLAILGKRLPVISMMVSMIFRFIPDTLAHGREIDMSRRALMGSPKPRVRLTFAVSLMSSLMAWSMENAIVTADAMKAKAYDSGKRRPYARVRWTAGDIAPVLLIILTVVTVILGWVCGGTAFAYYPLLDFHERVWAGGGFFIWISGCLALFALPFLLDTGVRILDRLYAARRQASEIDPFVTALLGGTAENEGV